MTTARDEKFLKDCEKYLPEDWRNRVGSMTVDEIKAQLVEVSKAEEFNQHEKSENQELSDAKEAYNSLGAGYKEATKINKLKLKFALKELKKYE